jgi:hypothetical protein
MNVSLLKRIIKEELANNLKEASIYKDLDGYFDTALQWIWLFGGKELLQNKLEIYSTSQNYFRFKKAMEDGKITIQDLDKATKGEHGQTGGIPFSQTAVWVNHIKPHLDRVKQDKINDLNIDLEEESATGAIGVGAGPIQTPYAFASKGQKTNKATQTAIKQGFKKAPGMPKNSKILDYKELWKGKKSSMNEVLSDIVKEELLNETSYNKFKNEVKYRTKNEMLHKSIREVKRKLEEVERLVEYTTRIKQELSENEDGVSYWKRSLKAINEISEVSNKISNKIKSIYQ